MRELILPIVLSVVASTGFWTFIQSLINNRKEKKSVERAALLALLHDRLYYLMQGYIKEGEITADEYENVECLYSSYKSMGGNGTCERLKKELDNVHIGIKE